MKHLSVAWLVLASGWGEVKVTVPVKGLSDSSAEKLKAGLGKLEGVAAAAVSKESLTLTIREGKEVSLTEVRKVVEAVSTKESPLGINEREILLAGRFDLVLSTVDDQEPDIIEGALSGYFEVSGKILVTRKAGEAKEGRTITVFRLEFVPKEGEQVTLGGVQETVDLIVTPGSGEIRHGIIDVRWLGPEKKP